MAKKILISSNGSDAKTGFGKNLRVLLTYLYSRKNPDGSKKWDCIEMAEGVRDGELKLKSRPWKCYGGMPADESFLLGQPRDNQNNYDPNLGKMVGYGAAMIEPILKKEKPDFFLKIEDPWAAVTLRKYSNRPYLPYWDTEWWDKFNTILWVPLDSLPLYKPVVENIHKIKHFFVKSSFAEKEMHRLGHEHVGLWPCLMDVKNYRVFSEEEKKENRKKYEISENCLVISFNFRNQARKSPLQLITGFKEFKTKYPNVECKVLLNTNFLEGWGIKEIVEELELNPNDVLCAHICHSCGEMTLKAIKGPENDCPRCGTQKSLRNITIDKGISEKSLIEFYNLSDGYAQCALAGGYEIPAAESAFTGVYTGIPNYSFGEMFADSGFCFNFDFTYSREIGSNFLRANIHSSSICDFMEEIHKNPEECREKGLKFREWAMNTIHPDLTLQKIESYLDSLPDHGYDFSFKTEWPDLDAPFSNQTEDSQWIIETYSRFFGATLNDQDKNYQAMQAELTNGATRESIYQKCKQMAENELKKRGQIRDDPEKYFKNDGRKRLLYTMAGDYGDSLISLPVLEELRKLYPADEWGLYISCLESYKEIYAHLDFIDGFVPWTGNQPFEMWEGARGQKKLVDVVIAPQVNRSYIHNGVDKNMFHPHFSLTSAENVV